jgi:hypothetical protein
MPGNEETIGKNRVVLTFQQLFRQGFQASPSLLRRRRKKEKKKEAAFCR